MSASALAFKYDELGDDLTPIESMTVDCYRCDPDNPLAIARSKCPDCQGTGRAPMAFASIVKELRNSRAELNKPQGRDDDLFLEY